MLDSTLAANKQEQRFIGAIASAHSSGSDRTILDRL
jgi:hypothetical protein